LIGLYLGNSSVATSFGAAGSLIALLLWVYYSAQIFFLGAEFTRHYALWFGSLQNESLRIEEAERLASQTHTENSAHPPV
jgi:membrane protein